MSDLPPPEDLAPIEPTLNSPEEVDFFQESSDTQVLPVREESILEQDDTRMIGNPELAENYWRYQDGPNDCALYAQGGVLDAAGVPFDIDRYRAQGTDAGWYSYDTGTTVDGMGELLEMNGVPADYVDGASIQDMARALNDGKGVVAVVDCDPLWGEPGGHALWVTGIEVDDAGQPITVFCNDSGNPDGQGIGYPYDNFQAAWDFLGDGMVVTQNSILPTINQDVL